MTDSWANGTATDQTISEEDENFDIPTYDEDTHTVTCYAVDAAGNEDAGTTAYI